MNSNVRVVALIGIEGHNTSGCTWRIVVCELSEWEQAEPIVLLVIAVDSDVLFQSLISSFGLSITFRVKTQGEVKLHVESETKRSEEVRDEFGTSVRSNVARDTMLRKDVNDK